MATKVVFELLSPLSLTNREDGRRILDLWKVYLCALLPDYYGNWEPIDRRFEAQDIEHVLDAWQWPFLAKRTAWSMQSSVWMRKDSQRLHAIWDMSFNYGAVSEGELMQFLKAASLALRADFACLHLLTPNEIQVGRASQFVSALNKKATQFMFSVNSQDLQRRLPELLWATVFGPPYVGMFGREQLLSAPASRVDSLSSDAVILQLSDALTDLEEHPREIENTRLRVKTHLGRDAFFQPELPPDYCYQVPQFTFC